ncbi:MAG: hypothetical protein ACI364_00455 [Coriobacteriales bacterium]
MTDRLSRNDLTVQHFEADSWIGGQPDAEQAARIKPVVSDQLAKLCSWSVVSMLNFHPRREAMPPTLVYAIEERSSYQVKADLGGHQTLSEIFADARRQLAMVAETETPRAYALIVDSAEEVVGLPPLRSFDAAGTCFPESQPTIFVFLGEREQEAGVFVVQAVKQRVIRGGATTMGAPLILPGPDSLLFEL